MLQLLDFLQLLGLDHRAVQVDHDDPKTPRGQDKGIDERPPAPPHHSLPAPPEDPQSDLPLLGERNLSHQRDCKKAQDKAAQDRSSHYGFPPQTDRLAEKA